LPAGKGTWQPPAVVLAEKEKSPKGTSALAIVTFLTAKSKAGRLNSAHQISVPMGATIFRD
jgi:hypothetical protein